MRRVLRSFAPPTWGFVSLSMRIRLRDLGKDRAERAGDAGAGESRRARRAVYSRSACLACHTIQGVSPGVIGSQSHARRQPTTIGRRACSPTIRRTSRKWIADAPALKPAP